MVPVVRGVLPILSMLDGSTTSFLSIYWICGSNTVLGVLSLSARNFWRKKFLQKQIFASWHLIAKIAKISASRKFPTIRYIMLTSTCTCNNNYLWLDLVEPSPVNLVSPYSGVVIRSVNVAWLVVSFHSPKHTQKHLSFLLVKFICRSFLESLDELHRYVPTHVVHNILFPEC